MGTYYGWASRADVIDSLHQLGEGYTLLDKRTVGSNHWMLIGLPDGKVSISLALLKCEKGDHGYKPLDETGGPYEVNCPLSFVERADATGPGIGYAPEWRAKVRAYHAAKKAAPEPETGMTVTIGRTQYRLHSPAGPRKGWSATRVGDGRMFRIPAAQLNRALQSQPLDRDGAIREATEGAARCGVPMVVFHDSEATGWKYTAAPFDHPTATTVCPPEPAKPGPDTAAVAAKLKARMAQRSSLGQLALNLD